MIAGNPLTMEISEADEVVWQYNGEGAGAGESEAWLTGHPGASALNGRDGSKLDSGNYIVVLSDRVVEVSPDRDVVWSYCVDKSVNDELISAQRLPDGLTLVTECGPNPRLCEVDAHGNVVVVIPLQPETDNAHQQTRMARKLPSGNYLVPHRENFVKEYDARGRVVHTFRTDIPELAHTATPEQQRASFSACRLDDGSTVIACASGDRVCVFDKDYRLAWQVSNAELGGLLNDACGLHVLKSGNILVSAYRNKSLDGIKMLEITREKAIVWTYQNPDVTWVHSLQVLSTNGQPE